MIYSCFRWAIKIDKTPQELSGFPEENDAKTFIKKELFDKYGSYKVSYKIMIFARMLYLHRVTSPHCGAAISVFCYRSK